MIKNIFKKKTDKENKKEQKQSLDIFNNDKILKLVAVIVAIVSWFVVSAFIDSDTQKDIKNIPIDLDISNTSVEQNGLEITSIDIEEVSISVKGKSYKVGLLKPEDFKVSLDMSSVTQPGMYSLEIRAQKTNNKDTDYEVEYLYTSYAQVTFERLATKTFDLEAIAPNITTKEGFFIEQSVVTPGTVEITGPSDIVSKIAYCFVESKATQVIDASTVITGKLKLYDADKNEIETTRLKIKEDSFKITIPLYKKKTVPIAFDYVNIPDGIDATKIEYVLSKNTIDIGVPADVATDIDNIVLGTIDFRSIDVGSVFAFDVSLLAGYINIEGISNVTVSFPSEGMSKTILSSNNIVFKNVPANFDATSLTKKLYDIEFVGLTESINELSASDVVVSVDLDGLLLSYGEKRMPADVYLVTGKQAWAVGEDYSILVKISEKTQVN